MQKRFNDLVVYVGNGVAVPALVLNSQLQADGREFLSLLYADPTSGPDLVLAGGTRKVGSVALGVRPRSPGAAFGWFDLPVNDAHAALLANHAGLRDAGTAPAPIEDSLVGTPGIHVPLSQRQVFESDSDKKSRLANLAFQNPPATLISTVAVEKEKDEAPGSGSLRYGEGADNWTQTGDGTDYPGSYGVGAQLKVGDRVRVIEADGQVNPNLLPITKIEQETPDGLVFFVDGGDSKGYFRDRVVRIDKAVSTAVPTLPPFVKVPVPIQPQAAPPVPLQPHGVDETYHSGIAGQSAAERLDEAQGAVEPGDPESPHAL